MQVEWDQYVSKEASITLCQHPLFSHDILSIFIKTFSKTFVKSYVHKNNNDPSKMISTHCVSLYVLKDCKTYIMVLTQPSRHIYVFAYGMTVS